MANILVIEDVPPVLLSLRIILTGGGHAVTCATDGLIGLNLLTESAFDLVISDIWMPALSGIDVISRGRAQSPGTKFLAITGGNPNSGASPGAKDVEKFGAHAVLFKPFEKHELLNIVSALLALAPVCG
jgi:CheY-like chemotaxis protein